MSDDLISREALKKEFDDKCAYECAICKYAKDFAPCKLIDNAPTVLHDNYSMGYQDGWITIEAGESLLKDHYWYLIAHKDYGTPIKAIYHSDCPHFSFFTTNGERTSYLFEDKITHYMELPDIPTGGRE